MSARTILDQDLCTGCSACTAGCPFDALTLDFDENGFYRPRFAAPDKCTHCGKCVNICPLNYPPAIGNRSKKPPLYAFETDEQTSLISSTAGGFQIVAKAFLTSGAVVNGAAWDGLTVKHILVDNPADLPKLYKSKYVQSFMGDIFSTTKAALEGGKRVLFSGLPCQVAGLHNYLAAQPQQVKSAAEKNLYTIDVLCHAAPPPKVFERYIEETFGKDNIVEYTFRAKEEAYAYGYGHKLKLKLKDGSIQFLTMQDDIFGKLFLRDIAMGKHCEQCRFTGYPHCSDITFADFWRIEQSNAQFQGGRTEAVLVNSQKGEELIRPLKEAAVKWKEQPLKFLSRDNVNPDIQRKANPNRDRFFEHIKRMPVTQAANHCFNNSYDIGLVGYPNNTNYGGALTYYALFHVLQDLGKSVLFISPALDSSVGKGWQDRRGWKQDPYLPFDVAPQCENKTAMQKLNNVCDMFLVGSDQLFATNGAYANNGKIASLDWVFDYKKKAAYAASFCNPYITCSDRERAEMGYYLSRFDYFSVREKSGVELCCREFNVKADWVLDPVFLCKQKHYESLLISNDSPPLLTCYILEFSETVSRIIDDVADKLSLPISRIEDAYRQKEPLKMEEWLSAFFYADFVITDSFHGTCFCLMFNKPFVTFCGSHDNQYRTPERMMSILELVGLSDRLVSDYTGYEKLQSRLTEIDWQTVNAKLDEAKRQSFAALEKAIAPLKKNMSDRDIYLIDMAKRDHANKIKVRLRKILKRIYDSRWLKLPRAVARRIRRLTVQMK